MPSRGAAGTVCVVDGQRGSRRGTDRRVVVDAAVALTLAALHTYAVLDPPGPDFRGPWWLVCAVAAAVALPLAARRLRPRAVLAVLLVAAVAATLAGVVGPGVLWVTYLPTGVALYTVASRAAPAWSIPALATCLTGSAAAAAYLYKAVLPASVGATYRSEVPLYWQVETAIAWVLLGTIWAVGFMIRWRRAVTERFAGQLAHAAVTDERLRIARELHDIVGHSLSLITVKATVASHLAASRPDETRAALDVIEDTSRHALTEVRRALGMLRSDGDTDASLYPTPGVADLAELADSARSASVAVDLEVSGATDLPETVSLSVYRIVQEALTNVVTHAAPTRCRITVTIDDAGADVEVVDEGPPSRASSNRPHGGHGLVGMRERVALFGGTFDAGPRPGGGFRVAARLPVAARDSA